MAVVKKNTYVITRTYAMGVFAGELVEHDVKNNLVVMANARRLYYWKGASTLSQLSVDGVKYPQECKFPCAVSRVILTSPQGFEILPLTEKARKSIDSVPVWAQ